MPRRRGADRDDVALGEPQPEALGQLGDPARVAAAVEQVVDERAAGRLRPPYRVPLGARVALGERADPRFERAEHRTADPAQLGGVTGARHPRQRGPGAAGRGEVPRGQLTQAYTGVGGLLAQRPAALPLRPGQRPAAAGDLGERLGESGQELHAAPHPHPRPYPPTHRNPHSYPHRLPPSSRPHPCPPGFRNPDAENLPTLPEPGKGGLRRPAPAHHATKPRTGAVRGSAAAGHGAAVRGGAGCCGCATSPWWWPAASGRPRSRSPRHWE